MEYNFNEKTAEWSAKQKKEIPVWVSPKYTQSRKKAIEIIEAYKTVNDGDFWILMNETKNGKMAYTGLIISHNACLKINDAQPDNLKFNPDCVTLDKEGYKGSLVYTYCNADQGIYEVGEVSNDNCKNAYPYAMAYKRLFDRVVLKLCKLAYDGIYSDSEADEFKEKYDEPKEKAKKADIKLTKDELIDKIVALCDAKRLRISDICKKAKVNELAELTEERLEGCIEWIESM
mgnify:CR=1 FL=1